MIKRLAFALPLLLLSFPAHAAIDGLDIFKTGKSTPVLPIPSLPGPTEPLRFETISKQTIPFNVEIADTPEKRANGLMNRDNLKPQTGMLFIFDKPTEPMFWMKDTKIRLDIIYIGEDGIVKGIKDNAIPFNTKPFPAPAPVIAVLEIAGGQAKTQGITKGAKVMHRIFEKDLK